MSSDDTADEAVSVLQQLGLKEYEAKCFVGLTRVSTGTAKRLSEITDVPRTRVYDAIRVLEAQGLVEIQHTSPQRFRAVSVEEAMETLREITDAVEAAASGVQEVSEATDEQATSVEEVAEMVDDVDDRAAEVAAALDDIAAATERQRQTVDDVRESVSRLT